MKPLYTRLAAIGIRKNGKAYIPYILTAAVMIAVFYITSYLTYCSFLNGKAGGRTMIILLNVGVVVLGIFALIFLFYTNSVLIKRRKREFGLYNILGLGKLQIAQVLVWETLLTYALSMLSGLGLGILFSKLAEMLATKMLNEDQNLDFYIEWRSVIMALIWFAIVFALILLNSLRQMFFSRPIQLLHSESSGEKPPKTNIPFAVIGVILLGIAYTMAIAIKDLSVAIPAFFAAVILVIIATYLLFITGSVALCRILRKNKKYYYKTNHFVSVSQMAYRMRRNGAGLASICILSTMVLVTVSSTTTLLAGMSDYVDALYPRDIRFTVNSGDHKVFEEYRAAIDNALRDMGCVPKNEKTVRRVNLTPRMLSEGMETGLSADTFSTGHFYIASEDAEVAKMGFELGARDIIIAENNTDYFKDFKTLKFGDWAEFNVIYLENFSAEDERSSAIITDGSEVAVLDFFVRDADVLEEINQYINDRFSSSQIITAYYFDIDGNTSEKYEVWENIQRKGYMGDVMERYPGTSFGTASKAEFTGEVFGLYGGLFFLGIMLGSVFILSAALIMYYKQISEGYEDAARFSILRKVGMSKREIRSVVNSQVLTVFFLPLVAAGVHMTFAFPILSRLLRMFGFSNTLMFALVTLGSYAAFAVIYILVYKATSKSYQKIVSG
ncbi:MAG: ABC transporter permease [Oscillospiraceae bacterium]|nr:ABC transporter permease [Oscillospiraceae bacterium]